MKKLAILYLFLPLAVLGMDPADPMHLQVFPPCKPGSLLPASSATTLSDIRTEVKIEPVAPEVRGGVPADRQKGRRPTRLRIKTSAVKYGGPLDVDASRKEKGSGGDFTTLLPVAPPPTDTAVSLTRTQPSTTAVDDFSGFPSSGLVRPPKWVKGLSISCQKPEARDSKTTQASKPVLSSGVVYPLQWRAELTKQ